MHTMSSAIRQDAKIFVAGHRGLVGSALVRALRGSGYNNLLLRTRQELDLRDQAAVAAMFAEERPEFLFIAAAKVGGIVANNSRPADFISDNLRIQSNLLEMALKFQVKRVLFLGSSCIYPRHCPQPMREEYLLTGPLEPTNRPYAIAKIAGIETCWAFNRQYGTRYLAAMPTNLYGPGDNYDLNQSHVIPGLIHKMHEAKLRGSSSVALWGTGTPRREFLYSDDLATACLFLMELDDMMFGSLLNQKDCPPIINVGCGEDLAIKNLAEIIRDVVGFKGDLVFDSSKPDGTPRKLLDVSRLRDLGWSAQIGLRTGLQAAYRDFVENHANSRLALALAPA